MKTKVIGLTGNIACGKSTAAKYLENKFHIPVIDADKINRNLLDPNNKENAEILNQIKKCFGTIDKKIIREIIFTNPSKKKELENILHPEIIKESKKQIEEIINKKKPKLIIYEASLVFETGSYKNLDGTLLIICNKEKQLENLLHRNPELNETLAKNMVHAQMPQEEKKKLATWVIENNSSLEELYKKIDDWLKNFLQRNSVT